MLDAIVLAAGYSSRAGTNKLMLPYGGSTILCHNINTLKPYCHMLYVVTGHFRAEIEEALKEDVGIRIIHNPDYPLGMFTSVQRGASKVQRDFLVMPGDCPLVSGKTIEALLKGRGPIRIPTFNNQKGHPIFISYYLKEALLNMPQDSNLRAFRDQYKTENVVVSDQGILFDVDTMEDYEMIVGRDGWLNEF